MSWGLVLIPAALMALLVFPRLPRRATTSWRSRMGTIRAG